MLVVVDAVSPSAQTERYTTQPEKEDNLEPLCLLIFTADIQ